MAETKKSGAFFTQGWIQVVIAFVVAIVTQGFGLYSFSILKVPMTEALAPSRQKSRSASPSTRWLQASRASSWETSSTRSSCAAPCCARRSCSRAVS